MTPTLDINNSTMNIIWMFIFDAIRKKLNYYLDFREQIVKDI